MARKSSGGGIKGFFERAGKSFSQGFELSKEWSWWLAQKGGTFGLFLASTSMVILMPLIFEINREAMVCLMMTIVMMMAATANSRMSLYVI
jgi:hypothetical protein